MLLLSLGDPVRSNVLLITLSMPLRGGVMSRLRSFEGREKKTTKKQGDSAGLVFQASLIRVAAAAEPSYEALAPGF